MWTTGFERAGAKTRLAFTAMTDTRETADQLRHLLATVAAAARPLVPFDRLGLALAEDAETVRTTWLPWKHTLDASEQTHFRRQWSDRLWPRLGGAPVCIRDAAQELNASFDVDRALIEGGHRSVLVFSLEARGCQLGVLMLDAREPRRFDEDHQVSLRSTVDLLALAIQHERLWPLEQERRRKRDQLQRLLPMIAEALDIRTVFPRLSMLLQDVIPHVTTSLVLLSPDRGGVRIHIASNFEVDELPEYRFSSASEAITTNWRSLVAYDADVVSEGVIRVRVSSLQAEPVFVELRPGPPFTRLFADFKLRSFVRVPVRVKEQPIGAIAFSSDRPGAYGEDDVDVATRVADHVALALAHEQLAEEARRSAQAQERAALLEQRVDALVQELDRQREHRALGESPAWKEALLQATRVADTEATVLITGESGTGKEVIARFIHRASRRARGPFVALNCAALPEQLLESELFGYERGAFTGAHVSRGGKIEQAAGGLLFLDEVGEMTPAVQAKFLRVLQEREFQRLGGARTLKADIRVIAATNRDPTVAIERGTLREDLYYRLCVFEITLPPLRERGSDILLLADAFLKEACVAMGKPTTGLSEEVRERLLSHAWPGNVRELRNAIERAVIMCGGGLVASEHLPLAVARVPRAAASATSSSSIGSGSGADFPAEGVNLERIERDLVSKALARAANNKSQAAKLLGLPRGQFYSLLRRYGLTDARR
jgi:transcriptional regulator with GAF, ATPase, and Fis domain